MGLVGSTLWHPDDDVADNLPIYASLMQDTVWESIQANLRYASSTQNLNAPMEAGVTTSSTSADVTVLFPPGRFVPPVPGRPIVVQLTPVAPSSNVNVSSSVATEDGVAIRAFTGTTRVAVPVHWIAFQPEVS